MLSQVQQARRTLTLEGTLSTSIQLQGQQLQAEAQMRRGPGIIQLKYLSGRFSGWQVIDQDGLVWRVSPEGKPSASPVSPEVGMALASRANLGVTYLGPARVAGRWARRYEIRPPGQSAGLMVIAVDARTSYPLASQRYGPNGRVVSETVYRSIRYNVAPPARVTPPAVAAQPDRHHGQGARQVSEDKLVKTLGGKLLKPATLPSGFQLKGYYERHTRRGTLAEIRYSDGLRTFFVGQMKLPRRAEGVSGSTGQRGNATGPDGRPRAGQSSGQRAERWWQRWQQWQHASRTRAPGVSVQKPGGNWQERLRGHSMVRGRRGDRILVVGGDLSEAELKRVLESIPYPPGQTPGTKI